MSDAMKTILFCTDFSPEADHAAAQALRLARSTNAKLIVAHLVHVASGELARTTRTGRRI
ncbi:MAG: universal stress protein [Candidatus Binatia bacterium]